MCVSRLGYGRWPQACDARNFSLCSTARNTGSCVYAECHDACAQQLTGNPAASAAWRPSSSIRRVVQPRPRGDQGAERGRSRSRWDAATAACHLSGPWPLAPASERGPSITGRPFSQPASSSTSSRQPVSSAACFCRCCSRGLFARPCPAARCPRPDRCCVLCCPCASAYAQRRCRSHYSSTVSNHDPSQTYHTPPVSRVFRR